MKLEVLDVKSVNGKTWALCKGNLLEYLEGLRTDFFEFSVQRKIVNNVYLDTIYTSILKSEPFPPITLTYDGEIPLDTKGSSIIIEENKVEILDGLQRTYRLWVVLFLCKLIRDSQANDLKSLAEAANSTEEGKLILQNRFITPKFIKSLFQLHDGRKYADVLMDSYSQFDVYFNIWTELDDKDVIRKMLVLNAGQKSVSSVHQFELLFLHFFEGQRLTFNTNITIIREKESRYREIIKGDRNIGDYSMSSIVVALQSFINGRQLRISTANMISLDDGKWLNDQNLEAYFNPSALSKFIDYLYELGLRLFSDSKDYLKWYGKDTVLSGVFGAIGAYMIVRDGVANIDKLDSLIDKICQKSDPFMLNEYYNAYENKLSSSKVNLGNAVRKAIFNYTKEYLETGCSEWDRHFSQCKDYDEE